MSGTVDRTAARGTIAPPVPDMKISTNKSGVSTPPDTPIPEAGESTTSYGRAGEATLPDLEPPTVTLTMSGLSLETLLDAVGFEQRRTEAKAGIASMEARAQERAMANEEKLKSIQEQLDKSRSFLGKFLKAFKVIGMIVAAVASVAMIGVGIAGLAAGGSGAALIALGITSMLLLASSITEEATGGKAGFSPGFIAGKIMEACNVDESKAGWIRMAIDLACTIALTVASLGVGAAGSVGKAAQTASRAVDTFSHVAGTVARGASAVSAGVGILQAGTGIASAVNERDISYLKAQQKRLEAILEKIAMANELDVEHLKEMLRRTEQTLQTVSEIVQEGARTNAVIMTGNPAMA